MNFELTEEQLMVRETIRDFAASEIKPGVMERDEKAEFPGEIIKKLGALGFMGMQVPEVYGGTEMDAVSHVITLEEIARVDASTCVIMSVNNSLFSNPILKFGSEFLKNKYLPLTSNGEKLGAYSLSEPQSGSDAKAMLTTATLDGDSYILTELKTGSPVGLAAISSLFSQKQIKMQGIGVYLHLWSKKVLMDLQQAKRKTNWGYVVQTQVNSYSRIVGFQ